jgi:DNA mismatch repair protein MutS2
VGKSDRHPVPPGIPDRVRVTDTLDLHGFFPEQIEEIMEAFLQNALDLRLRRLLIIHGKGKSRIKYLVIQSLKRHPRVQRFYDAPPWEGGWGATVAELNSGAGP